jgi:hypothetical protein
MLEAACAQYEIRDMIFFRKFVFVVVQPARNGGFWNDVSGHSKFNDRVR